MARRKTRKEKKRLFLISLIMVGLLTLLVTSVSGDFKQIMNNKRSTALLNEEYDRLVEEEEKLASEVIKMKDPKYIARYAKEKFLYSQKGEIIIRR